MTAATAARLAAAETAYKTALSDKRAALHAGKGIARAAENLDSARAELKAARGAAATETYNASLAAPIDCSALAALLQAAR